MTTNKPEVVAWLHSTRQDSDVITDKVRHVWGTPLGSMGEYTVALIRLSDYEALQAECKRLQAECKRLQVAMIEAKGHISHYMYGGSNYREPAAKAVALIDGAMQEVT